MKISTEEKSFKPVTITLESRREWETFLDMCDEAVRATRPRFHDDKYNNRPERTLEQYRAIMEMAIDLDNNILNPEL